MNKTKLRKGLQIIAFFLHFIWDQPFLFLEIIINMNFALKIIGGSMMIIAIIGTMIGLKKF